MKHRESSTKNALFGALGALAGVYAMDTYFELTRKAASGGKPRRGERRERRLDDISIAGVRRRADEPSTATLGRLAYGALTGREPDRRTRRRLSTAIHWGYGLAMGGLYGLLRGDDRTALDVPAGLGYGAALWLFGDELMVPVLGLARGPTAHSAAEHAHALGAHLVYGAATSVASQALHRLA